jgi:hypothetical protein
MDNKLNAEDTSPMNPMEKAGEAMEMGMNTVCLGDNSLQDAKDGEQVEFSATGTVKIDGGKRYVMIDAVDQDPVQAEDEAAPEEAGSDVDMARNQLKESISKQGGYNNAME